MDILLDIILGFLILFLMNLIVCMVNDRLNRIELENLMNEMLDDGISYKDAEKVLGKLGLL